MKNFRWGSWTLWFNIGLIAASGILERLQTLNPEVAWIGVVIGAIGIGLRVKTTKPLLN